MLKKLLKTEVYVIHGKQNCSTLLNMYNKFLVSGNSVAQIVSMKIYYKNGKAFIKNLVKLLSVDVKIKPFQRILCDLFIISFKKFCTNYKCFIKSISVRFITYIFF